MRKVVDRAIFSILMQSELPDEVVLWLAREEFPDGETALPWRLRLLRHLGLHIRFCPNLMSYKKLLPALSEYPEDLVVTADDDIRYPANWLAQLLTYHDRYPTHIIAHRGAGIRQNEAGLLPYAQWRDEDFTGIGMNNFFTGGAGALYPPHCLNSDIFDYKAIKKLAPSSDDLYFWAMAVLNGTKIVAIPDGYQSLVDLIPDKDSHSHLYTANCLEGRNDKAIAAIMERYPQLLQLLANEIKIPILK